MADLATYTSLIPQQHKTAPKFMATVAALCGPAVHVQNIMTSLIPALDPATAQGDQLDMIAEWVGLGRGIPVPITGFFFEIGDAVNPTKTGLGYGQWKHPNEPGTAMEYMNDEMFRLVLQAKILANHWKGDHDGAYDIARAALGDDVDIKITDRPPLGAAINEATDGNNLTISVNPTPDHFYPATVDNDLAIAEQPGVPYYAATVGKTLAHRDVTGTEGYYYYPQSVGNKITYDVGGSGSYFFSQYSNAFWTSDVGRTLVLQGASSSQSNTAVYNITQVLTSQFVYVTKTSGTNPTDGASITGGYWGITERMTGYAAGQKYFTASSSYISGSITIYMNKTLNFLDANGDITCTVLLKRYRSNAQWQGDVVTGSLPSSPVAGGTWALSTESTTTPGTGNYLLTPDEAYFAAGDIGKTINKIGVDGIAGATFEVLDYLLNGKVVASLETGDLPSTPITGGEWDFSTVTPDTTSDYIIESAADYFDVVGIELLDITWFDNEGDPVAVWEITEGVTARKVLADFASGFLPDMPKTIAGGMWMLEGDTLTLGTTTTLSMRVTITGASALQQALFEQKIIPLKPAGVSIEYVFNAV